MLGLFFQSIDGVVFGLWFTGSGVAVGAMCYFITSRIRRSVGLGARIASAAVSCFLTLGTLALVLRDMTGAGDGIAGAIFAFVGGPVLMVTSAAFGAGAGQHKRQD
jgi:hypothetical protein